MRWVYSFILAGQLVCVLGQVHLPSEVRITGDGHLVYGGNPTLGFYNPDVVNKLEITLDEPNWFQILDGTSGPGGTPGQSLIGSLTFNDTLVLDSVLISIKGMTSDSRNNTQKKSFSLKIDEYIDQELLGYDNLNLNCAFQDHSAMREVFYYDQTRTFAPALKGNFVDLYINGQNWGPYNNIQQIEGTYIKEWFANNEGTRWRAVRPDGVGGGGPGGNPFGAGVSSLNYNGPDSSDYNQRYTLKKYTRDDPWSDLITVCDKLNNLPLDDSFYDELKYYLDIDRALWFIAQEAVFVDDDSYIWKGGMDYYVYWDEVTNRVLPMDVDGNTIMDGRNILWSPFYNEDNADFPLMHRLMKVPEIRQRYLAHLRTILKDYFVIDSAIARVEYFEEILDQRVALDPKKIYPYLTFKNGVTELKNLIRTRHDFLTRHSEINQEGVTVSQLTAFGQDGGTMPPKPFEEVIVNVQVTGVSQKVVMYYGVGFDGVFDRVEMYDDGLHDDALSGDGIFGARIPGMEANQYVRYYIEVVKDDLFGTTTYYPEGAQHDVFIYQVQQAVQVEGDIVINEFMADNDNIVADNLGQFEDWVELYNRGGQVVNLSNYYLSDNSSNLFKWNFPDDVLLAPGEYLIVWVDDDEEQTTMDEIHAGFKLSANGESVILINDNQEIVDQIDFGAQETDVSMARHPNGAGPFSKGEATFNTNNDGTSSVIKVTGSSNLEIYPNPATEYIGWTVDGEATVEKIHIYAMDGRRLQTGVLPGGVAQWYVGSFPAGVYGVELQGPTGAVVSRGCFVLLKP